VLNSKRKKERKKKKKVQALPSIMSYCQMEENANMSGPGGAVLRP